MVRVEARIDYTHHSPWRDYAHIWRYTGVRMQRRERYITLTARTFHSSFSLDTKLLIYTQIDLHQNLFARIKYHYRSEHCNYQTLTRESKVRRRREMFALWARGVIRVRSCLFSMHAPPLMIYPAILFTVYFRYLLGLFSLLSSLQWKTEGPSSEDARTCEVAAENNETTPRPRTPSACPCYSPRPRHRPA